MTSLNLDRANNRYHGKRQDGTVIEGKLGPASAALNRAAAANELTESLFAIRALADYGSPIAKRGIELLEAGETLPSSWRNTLRLIDGNVRKRQQKIMRDCRRLIDAGKQSQQEADEFAETVAELQRIVDSGHDLDSVFGRMY